MSLLTNNIQNNALAALTQRAPQGVVNAIGKASAKTGVNFAYMVQQASAESSFDPTAKARTSSASGLYQFIESTWMTMIERYGEKHGIDTEGKSRQEILALRNDAETASIMAAEFASENERFLNSHWGGDIGSTELYFAHFLGAPKAAAFLKARDENPMQQAAILFPKAAKANRNVFYDTRTGRAKSMDEVYAFFDKKFEVKDAEVPKEILVAETAKTETRPRPVVKSSVFTTARKVKTIGGNFPRSYSPQPYHQLVSNPVQLMILSQLDLPIGNKGGIL